MDQTNETVTVDMPVETDEQQASDAVVTTAQEINPAEEAAMKFTQLLPFVKKMTAAMPSQKGVARVMHALAEFPLGASKPRLLNDGERQLFYIMQELSGYKNTILTELIKNNAQKAEQEKEKIDGGN